MRKRDVRKTRGTLVLDFRKVYLGGMTPGIFQPIDTPAPSAADFEAQFCEEILRRNPKHFEALMLLGDAYTRQGNYEKGLELDLKLSALRPDSGLLRYNLACSYALTGQKDHALRELDQAVVLGYRDVEHICHDRDLEALKTDPRFQALVRRLIEEQTQAAPHI